MAAELRDTLPPELRGFLHVCIESITQVELLILLRGSDRVRTARDIAADLGVAVQTARHDLETLTARGLLDVSIGAELAYRFRPRSEELGRYVDILAKYYVTSRHLVLSFVSDRARLASKHFADAFKIREPE
jgi:hypothetical protein